PGELGACRGREPWPAEQPKYPRAKRIDALNWGTFEQSAARFQYYHWKSTPQFAYHAEWRRPEAQTRAKYPAETGPNNTTPAGLRCPQSTASRCTSAHQGRQGRR